MRKIDNEYVANVLLAAIYTSDDEACAKYGVTTRTLRRYRERLRKDADLSAIVRMKRKRFDERWAESLPGALRSSIDFLKSACEKAQGDPNAFRNPAMITAISGAMKTCAEVVYTGKYIDARIDPTDREAAELSGPFAAEDAAPTIN